MPPQKQQRTLSIKKQKLNDRAAKIAQDAQQNDRTSIKDPTYDSRLSHQFHKATRT